MSARKPAPTRREHVELGAALEVTRDALMSAVMLTSRSYPHASRPSRAASKALRAIDDLRNALDDVSAEELKGDLWSPTIYYGGNREVRAAWLAANPLTDDPAGDAR